MGVWIDELLWMLTAQWPTVQFTVRIGRDQITEQADMEECLEISGATSLWPHCHLQLCEMLVMVWGFKRLQSSTSLLFPKPRRWFREAGGMCLKSGVRKRAVHSCSASCVWCNLTTDASGKVMYGCPCGHFQKLAAGLPFSLHQQ